MADICAVCGEEITSENREVYKSSNDSEEVALHDYCLNKYVTRRKAKLKKIIEQSKIDEASLQEIKDKSVHIISFDMPFGDMVRFMVKWALASIPAFIILAIIGAIFFAIFTAIFVSI